MISRSASGARVFDAGRPSLRLVVHEDGAWSVVGSWPTLVLLETEVLEAADGRRLHVRGDQATFHCANGGAVYELSAERSGRRAGRLLRRWGEED